MDEELNEGSTKTPESLKVFLDNAQEDYDKDPKRKEKLLDDNDQKDRGNTYKNNQVEPVETNKMS